MKPESNLEKLMAKARADIRPVDVNYNLPQETLVPGGALSQADYDKGLESLVTILHNQAAAGSLPADVAYPKGRWVDASSQGLWGMTGGNLTEMGYLGATYGLNSDNLPKGGSYFIPDGLQASDQYTGLAQQALDTSNARIAEAAQKHEEALAQARWNLSPEHADQVMQERKANEKAQLERGRLEIAIGTRNGTIGSVSSLNSPEATLTALGRASDAMVNDDVSRALRDSPLVNGALGFTAAPAAIGVLKTSLQASIGEIRGAMFAPNTAVEPVWMDSSVIRQSQQSISYAKKGGYTLDDIARGFAENPSDPRLVIDAVQMRDGGLTSINNSRPAVLNANGGGSISTRIRGFDELLNADEIGWNTVRRGGEVRVPNTWGEAVEMRIWKQGDTFMNLYPNGMSSVPKITGAPVGSTWSQFSQYPWKR